MSKDYYVGPQVQIHPDELYLYSSEIWSCEEKIDGFWAEVKTDQSGRIVRITGRSGKVFAGSIVEGLIGLQTNIPDTVIVCELEAGTEAADVRYRSIGYRRLFAFDVPYLLGNDTTILTYDKRRELLEMMVNKINSKHVILVRSSNDFKTLYDDVKDGGGEGVVLKKRSSKYGTYRSSRKTDEWIRCKEHNYVDYVVIEVGKSKGGSDNFQVGLYDGDELVRVGTIKNISRWVKDPHAMVGKVIECKGLEVHKSGILRSGHFVRERTDKSPKECIKPRSDDKVQK